MAVDKDLIKLAALEFVLIEMLCREYQRYPDPVKTASDHRAHLRRILRETRVPGLDPALSDVGMSELEAAVDSIVEQAGRRAGQIADEQRRP